MSHSHHGGMDMDHDMCSMNMLFTWDTNNLCIVFRSWHVRGTWSLILSLIAVVALSAGYELIRELSRRYEERLALKAESPELQEERRSLLWSGRTAEGEDSTGRLVKAMLYGLQVFYSFFIMLIFMTYQGHIMIAVGVGATLGYLMFGRSTISKSAACH